MGSRGGGAVVGGEKAAAVVDNTVLVEAAPLTPTLQFRRSGGVLTACGVRGERRRCGILRLTRGSTFLVRVGDCPPLLQSRGASMNREKRSEKKRKGGI